MDNAINRIAKELTEQQKKTKEVFDSTNIDEQMGKKVKEIAKKWKDSDQKGKYQDFVKKELEKTDIDEKMKSKIKELSKKANCLKTSSNLERIASELVMMNGKQLKELGGFFAQKYAGIIKQDRFEGQLKSYFKHILSGANEWIKNHPEEFS